MITGRVRGSGGGDIGRGATVSGRRPLRAGCIWFERFFFCRVKDGVEKEGEHAGKGKGIGAQGMLYRAGAGRGGVG